MFVNADEIARQRWPEDPATHAYEAARVAAETRSTLLDLGRSSIAETVFSHPSKLALVRDAHAAGYTVVVHVLLIPEELAVQRVQRRVLAGGHDVPEAKIRQRFHRLWPLVAAAATRADIATIYDNSRREGPRVIARISGGVDVGTPSWPAWTPQQLRSRWPN